MFEYQIFSSFIFVAAAKSLDANQPHKQNETRILTREQHPQAYSHSAHVHAGAHVCVSVSNEFT